MKTITLESTLPRVFVNERIPASDVWQRRIEFERGKSYLVEATSGGGKSSMCSFIFGARTDYEGRILFDGRDSRDLQMGEWLSLRRTSLAYLPQELSLFAELSAFENIKLKNQLTDHIPEERIEEWLDRLGISSRRNYPAGRMSIGQQQRVAIIRSICQPFDFILLDEPVSHLDAVNNRVAASLIVEEAARQGAAIISTSVGNHLDLDYDFRLKL
ncbi:MAG: ATP-binding cassette domain-containing protein [Muribaculaceae bacterium]|nr:ATP-binding cassette domain-containing protein [Muribaculaceae bacterium]